MHGIVDQHDRSEAAGSEAADGFDGEEKIVRRALLVGELELLIEGVQNAVRLLDVAGGAVAELDDVFALRLHREMGVEGRHAVDPRRRDADAGRDIADHVLRQIFINSLNLLKNRNQPSFGVVVLLQNFVYRGEMVDHRLGGFHGFLHFRSL